MLSSKVQGVYIPLEDYTIKYDDEYWINMEKVGFAYSYPNVYFSALRVK